MQKKKTVEEYIGRHSRWQTELETLRELVTAAPLDETIKWGAPVYTSGGKNVVGLGAFKSYVGLWFFQGALLKDSHQKLFNAQENKTKAMRQWRFNSLAEIQADADLIKAYIAEAIANQEQGRAIKPDRDKELIIPEELQRALSDDAALKQAFEALSKGKRREYADYISEAKREETRQKRLEKIIPMILDGRGLHDKYRR